MSFQSHSNPPNSVSESAKAGRQKLQEAWQKDQQRARFSYMGDASGPHARVFKYDAERKVLQVLKGTSSQNEEGEAAGKTSIPLDVKDSHDLFESLKQRLHFMEPEVRVCMSRRMCFCSEVNDDSK
jgi:hypothetical protein